MTNEFILRKHPVSAGISAKTAVVGEEDEVGTLAITALEHLEFGLVRRRGGEVSIETQFHGHAACLGQVNGNREGGEASSHSLCRSMSARRENEPRR